MKNIIFMVLFFLLSCGMEKREKDKQPNLLIVLSDQHSFDMLGTYGNTQIITPNLDQFASEGIRFENAFSNQPVCTPFRGMLMSGMHPLKNGAFMNDTPLIPNKTKLLAEVLKENGYQTAYIGKWHLLGGDRDRPIPENLRYGFDTVLTNNCHVDFRAGKSFFWNQNEEKEFFGDWEVYGQTQQALQYLDDIDDDKPFALIVSWHPPHDWGLFKGKDGKKHFKYDTLDELMALYNRDSIQLRSGMTSSQDIKRMYHGHMAMVSGVDKAFGMLMDKLKEKGIENNTLTIFSSDHGDMLESHDAKKPKQYVHDYSSRIPFIVKYPRKIEGGNSTKLLFSTLDIMPTSLGLLDITTDQKYDGVDLSKEILTGDEEAVSFIPMWIYTRYNQNKTAWRGVITKKFTFSFSQFENDSTNIDNVLFDRINDPKQQVNLFYNPEFKTEKENLKKLTYGWMDQYNDQFFDLEFFIKNQPRETWQYNYSVSPFDHIQKQ